MRDSTIIGVTKVVGANAGAVSTMFMDVNQMLTSLSLVLATLYTLYKFYKEVKSDK